MNDTVVSAFKQHLLGLAGQGAIPNDDPREALLPPGPVGRRGGRGDGKRVIENEAGYVELARDGDGVETAARPEADLRLVDTGREIDQVLHGRGFHSAVFGCDVATRSATGDAIGAPCLDRAGVTDRGRIIEVEGRDAEGIGAFDDFRQPHDCL